MANYWGTLALNITEYERPAAETFMAEKKLLPSPAGTSPLTVLMGGGRLRKRRTVSGWADKTDFDSLETDYYAMIKKTAFFYDGFSMDSYIEKLDGNLKEGTSLVFYSATFVEA